MKAERQSAVLPKAAHEEHQIDVRISTTSIAVLFPLFTLLVFLPFSLYFSNIGEFTLRLRDMALIFLPALVFSFVCTFGFLLLLPAGLRSRLSAVSLALGLLFWVQGSLLVWQYGTFDGRSIAWEDFWLNGVIDSPVWLFGLAAAVAFPATFLKLGRPAAVLVMLVQSLPLAVAAGSAAGASDAPSARNYSINSTAKYSFSPERNVILFVLDAYQSDVFNEIVSDDPTLLEEFDGFTYFPNAVAASNYTEIAIPALLTGKMYDNSRPRQEFLREAYLGSSITKLLKDEGFAVDIYPWLGWGNESIYFDPEIASNLVLLDSSAPAQPTFTEKKGKEALQLLDMSLLRAAPHFLKRYVFNDQRWLMTYVATYLLPEGVKQTVATDDQFAINTFLDRAPSDLALDAAFPTFKYYHLKGAHSPLTVDADLRFSAAVFPFSRQSYVQQAKANLVYLARFFERLRRAGIYHDSLILILGDHGSGESPEMYLDEEKTPMPLEGSRRNFRKDKARAIPLVLIKQIGASGPLEISHAPVSLQDIPATIGSELGLSIHSDQPSMFSLDETAPRLRHHGAFEFSPNRSDFVGEITLYRIEGDSWLNESWSVEAILPPAVASSVEAMP